MEQDNACETVNGETVNGEPDAKSCIYVSESLTNQNCELLGKAGERAKDKQYLYKGYTVKK